MFLRLTIRHYFDFGPDAAGVGSSLLENPQAWDDVRRSNASFGFAVDRADLISLGRGAPELRARASTVLSISGRFGSSIASYGVGAAALEAQLLDLSPDLRLTMTEFAPLTLGYLRRLFAEQQVVEHDLRTDGPLPADLHLFNRIDSEFDDDQWHRILSRFAEPVLMVATEFLGPVGLAREVRDRFKRRATQAGYTRTRGSFRALFGNRKTEQLQIGDLSGFLLLPS